MLCKVLAPDTAADSSRISLPPWLLRPGGQYQNHSSAPAERLRPARPQVSSAEIQELRARVEELSAQLEREAKNAFEQGFRAGDAAARKTLETDLRNTVGTLAEQIAEVAAQRPETIRRAEADTVRLAIEIARRVLHREISIDPTALSALVGAALEKLGNQEIYRVRVHPDLEKVLRAALVQSGRSASIEVVPDPSLARGGVSFEISRGALDASVDTQLREIERGLADELKARA